ncbi:uncharacterized protein LOC115628571 isoform X2 [Scaptodrosophila lebanonensis]|uniref:Uncharacterized protein LOC115628571 isoform X2 n=1 Tax=Drosophila lebanonensis TaxID=7225 RepID=A0A6J2TWT3_DROLE|nr:uncharacterized protein LOC115628571 isoform X2 [Scaptodrosophila lebanonensis]
MDADGKSTDDSAGSDSVDMAMTTADANLQKQIVVSSVGESTSVAGSNSSSEATTTIACNIAFETKVTQISQDLKETTLAETVVEMAAETEDAKDSKGSGDATDSPINSTPEGQNCDRRVKKVRFHQDVKENDGGNRVKKKRRPATKVHCDGMDLDVDEYDDEEEEEETEEEFDLAKTIAEAEDYLKQHPLTFVRRAQQNAEEVSDDNDEDFYKRIHPENGIERILGKETKAGKVEFLLRYENQGGLFWESEDYIRRKCPSLLRAYEKNRERRQQRLMNHVAKRQSLRQRYTDF